MPSSAANPFLPTDEQRQAIEHVHGPMLVVAGAGTGKTTVLAHRMARLIHMGFAKPDEILAVTYTRNAAAELLDRVAKILYPDHPNPAKKLLATGLQATTFHAYCYKLLVDAHRDFALIDDKDLFIFLRRRVAALDLKHFIKAANLGKFLSDLLEFFRRCHDELRTPAHYDAYVAALEAGTIPLQRVAKSKDAHAMPAHEVLGRCHEIARVFRYVEDQLRREDLGTYSHIITRAVDMLEHDEEALHFARRRARFILVDEFQDSNVAQIQLARLLAGDACNVFAVGDPDQAIYRFRGATTGAFDKYLNTFGVERVKRVMMSQNRRSTPPILRCAHWTVSLNPEITTVLSDSGWKRQPLMPARVAREPQLATAMPVEAIIYSSADQEAEFIADTIDSLRRKKRNLNLREIAVLYPQHRYRTEALAELRRRGIPVQVKGVDLFETTEIRDALAALRALDFSDPIALFRVAALPLFKVNPEQFRAELALAGRGASVEATLDRFPEGKEVLAIIRAARAELAGAQGDLLAALKIAQRVFRLPDSKLFARLRAFCELWSRKPKQIVGSVTLHEFVEYLDLYQEAGGSLTEDGEDDDALATLGPKDISNEEPHNAVQLMTIHAAKGLEFRHVFVIRINTAALPSNYKEHLVDFPQELRSPDTRGEGDPKTLHEEEQRRLFYVAMTRAMDSLYVSGKAARGNDSVPTKYLRELVKKQKLEVPGAIEYRSLQQPLFIPRLHAAAAEPLPRIAQWVQLPPRADARLCDLSASAIDQYERCPLAYKLSRDWRIPEAAPAYLQYGSAIHLALKAHFDGVRAGRPLSEEMVIACFLDEFGKTTIDEELQRELYQKKGREELTRLLRSELAQPEGEILDNERKFNITIGDAKVVGRLDRLERVDGEVIITDYKTGRPKTQEDADKSFQLSVYAVAAKHLGMRPRSLVFINLENGSAVATARDEGALLDAEAKIQKVAACIAAGEFEPKPERMMCRNCSYFSICPAQEQTATSN